MLNRSNISKGYVHYEFKKLEEINARIFINLWQIGFGTELFNLQLLIYILISLKIATACKRNFLSEWNRVFRSSVPMFPTYLSICLTILNYTNIVVHIKLAY